MSPNGLLVYWLTLFSILTYGICSSSKLEVEKDPDSFVAQKQLHKIYEQAKHMQYGQCWTEALEQLQTGCRRLTDDVQRRIAYAFARCHLQSSARDIPECKADQPVSECTNSRVMQDAAYITYTEFFTHTQQICFHLQSQMWHEATEVTISKLADNSAEVALSLEESSSIARQMVERQNVSLQNQEELLRNEKMLRENMHKSVLDVQKSHAETTAVIREQKVLFIEVFDRVSALQKTVLGEFSSIYTFGFYIGSAILAYVLTSTPRTASARIWLFILITMNFFTEKIIVNYHLASTSSDETHFIDHAVLPEIVYRDTWLCREVYCCLAFVLMLYCIVRYKDYGKMNHRLLNEIKRQNIELQNIMKTQGIDSFRSLDSPYTPGTQSPVSQDSARPPLTLVASSQGNHLVEVFADASNALNESSQTNDLSLVTSYHSDADSTFVANNHTTNSSESSFSSYITGNSRPSTPLDSVPAMLQSFASTSTPSGRSYSRRSSISSTISFNEKLNESVVEAEGVIVGGHNLRRRRQASYRSEQYNGESVETFIKSVAKVTVRRKKIVHR